MENSICMVQTMKLIFSAAAVLVAIAGASNAQDYDKGYDAYSAGHNSEALDEWQPMAENGDAAAQYNLGIMYEACQGRAQDYAAAVYLINGLKNVF